MKILFVNKFLYPNGGSETYILKLGDYLRTQGHEVEYFGMEHKGRCVSNRAEAYTSDIDFHNGKLSKILYPFKIIYSYEARRKIRLVLDAFQPEVVHLNNFNFQLTPSVLLEIRKYGKETKRRVKVIFTAHDYQLLCPNHMMRNPVTGKNCEKCLNGNYLNCIIGKCIHKSTVRSMLGVAEAYYWRLRKTYRFIDRVICPTYFIEKKMSFHPLLRGKTVPLHNFIHKEEWKGTGKEDYIIYFGRFSEEKGIGTLIDICTSLPDIKFVFAGSGPLESRLAGIPNIRNMGFQTGEALKRLIRGARFSIYPSEWYENCPFSVMESQMYGTPVLGADIGGIPELIRCGETGELFRSRDAGDLKQKILMLWNDKDKTMKYSGNCKDIRFDTIGEYYDKLMDIYRA